MAKKKFLTIGKYSVCYTPLPFPLLITLATLFFLSLCFLFLVYPSNTIPRTEYAYHQAITLTQPVSSVAPAQDFCQTVPVLLYHHIQPLGEAKKQGHASLTIDTTVFEQQARYIVDQGYLTLSAQELVTALLGKVEVPEKSIILTFDDGYADWYTYLYPLLKKYQIHANLMISSGLIGTPGYLTWEQLQEMEQSPFVTVYNHTWSHKALGDASKELIDLELTISQKEFEKYLGFTPSVFTYPYGSTSVASTARLKLHGFQGAFTTQHGRVHCLSSIMNLPREHIGNAPLSFYDL